MSRNTVWAVIGGGNGGQSMAGHLALMGYRVRLYDIFAETIEAIDRQGGIEMECAQGTLPILCRPASHDNARARVARQRRARRAS